MVELLFLLNVDSVIYRAFFFPNYQMKVGNPVHVFCLLDRLVGVLPRLLQGFLWSRSLVAKQSLWLISNNRIFHLRRTWLARGECCSFRQVPTISLMRIIFPITLMIVCRVMGEGNVPGIEDLDAAIAALARFNLIIVVIIVLGSDVLSCYWSRPFLDWSQCLKTVSPVSHVWRVSCVSPVSHVWRLSPVSPVSCSGSPASGACG